MSYLWSEIQNYVYSAGGAVGIMVLLFIFFGRNWIEKKTIKSIANHQNELNKQLEKLRAANAQVNHIMTSLYNEEKEAIKEISGTLSTCVHEVFSLATVGAWENSEKNKQLMDSCAESINNLSKALNKHVVFLDVDIYEKINQLRASTLGVFQMYKDHIYSTNEASKNEIRAMCLDEKNKLKPALEEVISLIRNQMTRTKTNFTEVL